MKEKNFPSEFSPVPHLCTLVLRLFRPLATDKANDCKPAFANTINRISWNRVATHTRKQNLLLFAWRDNNKKKTTNDFHFAFFHNVACLVVELFFLRVFGHEFVLIRSFFFDERKQGEPENNNFLPKGARRSPTRRDLLIIEMIPFRLAHPDLDRSLSMTRRHRRESFLLSNFLLFLSSKISFRAWAHCREMFFWDHSRDSTTTSSFHQIFLFHDSFLSSAPRFAHRTKIGWKRVFGNVLVRKAGERSSDETNWLGFGREAAATQNMSQLWPRSVRKKLLETNVVVVWAELSENFPKFSENQ